MVALLFLLTLFPPGLALADWLYVTDEFRITMRTGPSLEHRVINMLPSGSSVQVLDESPDWFQIRTPNGQEGWIMKQYTMQRTPNSILVENLNSQVGDLQSRLHDSEQETKVLGEKNADLQLALQTLQQEFQELQTRHQTLQEDSGNIQGIKHELQLTSNELEFKKMQFQELEQENQALRSRNNLNWFLAGGGTITVAALFGFILGRIQKKRSKKYIL